MANTGEIIVTKLRMYINGQATKTTKVNAPGDKDYIQPFVDTNSCFEAADPVAPVAPPTPPTPTPVPVPVPPTPTQCYYHSAEISSTAGANSTEACNSATFTTMRHDNSQASAFPQVGDIVWTDCGNTVLASGYYSVENLNKAFHISGTDGRITKVSTCGATADTPLLPCSGNNAEWYISAGRQALADFCGQTGGWSVTNSVMLPTAVGTSTHSSALNKQVCDSGMQFTSPGTTSLYYIVASSPYTANPDANEFDWWKIDVLGVVRDSGSYSGCAQSGGDPGDNDRGDEAQ